MPARIMGGMAETNGGGANIPRAQWHTRISGVVFMWMAAAAVTAVFRDHIKDSTWLMVHFLLLGAVTNALFIWSWHFAGAILRVPQADRADEIMRLSVLNLGVAAVLIGATTEAPVVAVIGVVFVGAAVVMHALAIRRAAQRALPSPYAFTADAYLLASSLLVLGIFLGGLMEAVAFDDATKARVVLAHVSFNLLGWIGIPILGTIVTLWPTMLRTRIAPNAAKLARRVLPVIGGATVAIAVAFAFDLTWLAAAGLVAYIVGFMVTLLPMVAVARNKRPATFSTISAGLGMLWLVGTLVVFTIRVASAADAPALAAHSSTLVVSGAVGGVLQVLLGCLSYLLPAMAAGGPSIVRYRNDRAERLLRPRLLFTEGGLLLWVVGLGNAMMALTLLGLVTSVIVIGSTLRTPSKERAAAADAERGLPE